MPDAQTTTRAPVALIVDDDRFVRESLREILELEGCHTLEAEDGKTALDVLEAGRVDLLLLDLVLPRVSGIEVLRRVAEDRLDLCPVIISGQASIPHAVTTMKLGAYDFLEKPLQPERTLLTIRNALEQLQQRRTSERSSREAIARYGMDGSSPAICAVYESIDRAAATRAKVLIVGESGTGKELVARAIHRNSRRAAGPFVALNCAALPDNLIESELFGHARGAFTGATFLHKGKFEQAHRGTLFLDEIGDMALATQAKLLRALEEQQVQRVGAESAVPIDVRLLAATHCDLESRVRDGSFREDLFYRLNVLTIHVPPLRQRREDTPELASFFLAHFASEHDRRVTPLTASATAALKAYDWPGNVRELRNAIERVVLFADDQPIDGGHIRSAIKQQRPRAVPDVSGLREARDAFERDFIVRTLEDHGWRIHETAAALGINRSHLWKKMRHFAIESPQQDAEPTRPGLEI
ncbi:MAG: sigma-54-dependent transcriptional regulator [Longimicrobiales bacterium]